MTAMTHDPNRPPCLHRGEPAGLIVATNGERLARYRCNCSDLPQAAICAERTVAGITTTPAGAMPACDACPHYRRPAPPPPPLQPAAPTDGNHYQGFDDLAAHTLRLAAQLPPDLQAIIGLPRSGMMPAAQLATLLHLPLFHLTDGGAVPTGHGARGPTLARLHGPVLLIDDSTYSGRTLQLARQSLPADQDILTAAVYATPHTAHLPDLVGCVLADPHLFAWNLYNSERTSRYAFDFDGIICADLDRDDDDDGPRYTRAIREAKPLYLPRRQAPAAVITARPVKYKTQTLAWLEAHACPLPAEALHMPAQRIRDPEELADWKARAYETSGATLFVESTHSLAVAVFLKTLRPVLCPETKTYLRK